MVELQTFEGATNRTALVSVIKGKNTNYPVPYILWRKLVKGAISLDLKYKEVEGKTKRLNLKAQPISHKTSPWISARYKALSAIKKIIGNSFYQAKAGSSTWINGVFWGKISDEKDELVRFENEWDVGKNKVKSISAEIENKLVYPLLRGREVKRWYSSPEIYIIVSQNPETRTGYNEDWMQKNLPKTWEYFKNFESILVNRSGYKKYLDGESFYSIYNVSESTFSPYKVVWKSLANGSQAVVVGTAPVGKERKVIIPEHNTMLVPFQNSNEAHYFCALFNCSITSFLIVAYISWFYSTHVLENIAIPKFNSENSIHQDLSNLSKQCHEKTASGIDVTDLEEQIDELAAELWGLTKDELKDIKDSLAELK